MFTRSLLTGASALAMLAGATTASAQANTENVTGTGTGNVANCNNGGATNSSCTITQNGDNNNAQQNQTGDNLTAEARQNGDGNSSSINQNGDDSNATTVQTGDLNQVNTNQTGTGGSISVTQNGISGATVAGNTGFIQQENELGGLTTNAGVNTATVTQNRTLDADTGNSNNFFISQRGANTANLSQSGSELNAQILQGGIAGNANQGSGRGNGATISQSGTGSFVGIDQRSATAGANVNGNTAIAETRDGANTIFITQQANGNQARAFTFGGTGTGTVAGANPGDPRVAVTGENFSSIFQRNSGAAATVTANNEAFVSNAAGSQQQAQVFQDGRDNFADVTITSGVAGSDPGSSANDPTLNRSGGNFVNVNQTGAGGTAGRGSVAIAVTGAQRGTTSTGFGNSAQINQVASATQTTGRGTARTTPQSTTRGGVTITEFQAGQGARANGQFAQTFQFGRFGSINSQQNGDAVSGTVQSDGQVARSRAAFFQGGERNQANLTQNGDNYAEITQGGLSTTDTVNSRTTINQTDAGNASTTGAGGTDPFGNPTNTTGTARAFNVAAVVQNGGESSTGSGATLQTFGGNQVDVSQNTIGGFASVFQRRAANSPSGTSGGLIANIDQGNRTGAASGGANSTTLTAIVDQGGTNNGALINQGGSTNTARVLQLGTNANTNTVAGGGQAFTNASPNGSSTQGGATGNQVTITQTGTNNNATANQNAGTGRSSGATAVASQAPSTTPAGFATGFNFAGGARSAEIQILQSNTGNTATVNQNGLGQFARIEQTGQNNNAGITQAAAATNATAVIRQSGNTNSFFVNQTAAGAFIVVDQTGNGNNAQQIDTNGGSTFGFTPQ